MSEIKRKLPNLSKGNYIVAFIDALGSKERFSSETQEDLFKTFQYAISEAKELSRNIKEVGIIDRRIKMRTFSDNIFFYLKLSGSNMEKERQCLGFIRYINSVQVAFLENCWLMRGAITIGKLLVDKNIIFGEALLNAYKMESEIAKTPRIILDFDYEFWQKITTRSNGTMFLVERDIDGKNFLNYIPLSVNNHWILKRNIEKLFKSTNNIEAIQKLIILIEAHNRIYDKFKDNRFKINIKNLLDKRIK